MTSREEKPRKLFMRIARQIHDKGFVSGTSENTSAQAPGTNKIPIKPTGLRSKELTPKRLLLLDLKDFEEALDRLTLLEETAKTALFVQQSFEGEVR